MSASNFLSRVELALIRRLPFKVQSAFVPRLGQVIEFPQHAASTFGEIFLQELYRPLVPMPSNPTIVDLGTNLGMFCMYINGLVSDARIYGFEANPLLFPFLVANIRRLPDRRNHIELFNVAVSDAEGFLDFKLDHTNPASVASTAFLDVSAFPDAANYRPVRVPCAPVGRYVPGRIDFLKCDIEGAEYGVLGDGLLTPARVGQGVIEFHDLDRQSARFRQIIETASASGFMLYAVGSDEPAPAGALLASVAASARTSAVVRFCDPALRQVRH